MRDIKFRGKDLKTGNWTKGYVVELSSPTGQGCFIISEQDLKVNKSLHGNGILFTLHDNIFMVNKDTVGQFTGMRDINGVELFENDIIESIDDIGQIARHRIVYDYSSGGWFAIVIGTKFKGYVFRFNQLWLTTHNKTIIGNIHDNPELLEGGEK